MNSTNNNMNSATATATATANGWQPFMNRKARRAALRRARNRTITQMIEAEKAAVWTTKSRSTR
jgi:hypothetical protein